MLLRIVRRRRGGSADPLGNGNSSFINSMGVSFSFFYDVRKNLSLSGANFVSLNDIKGDGTYGPQIVPFGTAPTFDGLFVNTTTLGSMVSVGPVSGIDLTAPFTYCFIGKITTTSGTDPVGFGNAAVQYLNVLSVAGNLLRASSPTSGGGPQTTVGFVTGNVLIVIIAMTGNGTGSSIEVPNMTKFSGSQPITPLTSTPCNISFGSRTDGAAKCPVAFRSCFGFPGLYSAGQQAMMVKYAQTWHFGQTQ